MSKLAEHLDRVDGIEASKALSTDDGHKYRVVRASNWTATVLVDGVDSLDFKLVSEGKGGIYTIEKSVIDTLVGLGVEAVKGVLKVIGGQCYTQNHQEATFDPKTGNMTGFTNTTTVVCPPD